MRAERRENGLIARSRITLVASCLHRAHRRDKCADKDRVAIEGARGGLAVVISNTEY